MNDINTKNKPYVAIMAGGVGSRFWPASKESVPKQFLDIMGMGKSLIRLTFERFLKLTTVDHIFIVTNKMYKDLVKQHLPELSDNQIICEPSRNNTAPCIAYTALKLKNLNENATIVVAPSDHIILKEDVFVEKINLALDFSKENTAITTLGISPTRPDTGYGYINFEAKSSHSVHKVIKFTEKPNLDTAREFVKSGQFLWNAGIFIFQASVMLNSIQENEPQIYDILSKGIQYYNTEEEQDFIDREYPKTPNISIDFAVMEKAQNVYTIPSDIGWSDLGTWNSLYKESEEKDSNGNAIYANQSVLIEMKNNLIRVGKEKMIVAKGLEDYIIVEENNVLLIYPKGEEQDIKLLKKELEKDAAKHSFL